MAPKSSKRLFLDTEFSSFDRPEPISIALVPEDEAREPFYAELRWIKRKKCSEFTLKNVIPALIGRPKLHEVELAPKLADYLADFGRCHVVCTLPADAEMLFRALGGFHRPPTNEIADAPVMTIEIVRGFPDRPVHNALQDAMALRKWYMDGRGGRNGSLET